MTARNTARHTLTDEPGIRTVDDEELRTVRGGKSIWGHIKDGARWVKNHVVATLHSIGIKGQF
jgi:hypothetical protein